MDSPTTSAMDNESTSLLRSSGRRPLDYKAVSINSDSFDENSMRSAAVMSRYKYYQRLVPHPENPLVMPDHVVPSEFWTHIPVVPTGKQHSLITIFSIWNTMMGTSLLSMPWAVSQAGFGLGLALMVIMAGITLYTSYRVMKSVDTIPVPSGEILEFSDVCRHFLGRPGEIAAVVVSVVALLGGAIVYWVLMSNFLYNTVLFIYNHATPGNHSYVETNFTYYHDDYITCTPSLHPSKPSTCGVHTFIPNVFSNNSNVTTPTPTVPSASEFTEIWDLRKTVPFFLLIVLLPLINFKSPTFFTKFNAVGTISVMYLLGFVTYKASIWGFHMDLSATGVPGSYAEASFPALMGILSLAYFVHNCVLSIVRNQAKPENNGRDLTTAFICVSMTYCYVGCMFYAAWPMITKSCLDQNLLNNLLTEDPMAFVARIFLFVQMLTVFPLLLYVMRVQVMHSIFNSVWPSLKHILVMNLLVIGVCLVFASLYPNIGTIIRYTGAFCGLVYAFFLPCSTYLLGLRAEGRLTYGTLFLHAFLVLIGLGIFVSQFIIKSS